MRWLRPFVPVGLIAVLLAGCSGPSHRTPTRPQVSATGPIISAAPSVSASERESASGAEGAGEQDEVPCPLVSEDAVGAAFGARIASQTTSSTGAGGQLCLIRLANSNLGPGISLHLSRIAPASPASFRTAKQAALAHGALPVAGVGQDAYYSPAAHNLQYLSGSTTGALQVRSGSAAALAAVGGRVQADLVALARAAVANQ